MSIGKYLAASLAVAVMAATLSGCPRSTLRTNWFTQVFVGGNNLDGVELTLTPVDTPNGYLQTVGVASDFPTDPTGGLVLDFGALGDPILAGTFGGAEVPFYGELYDTLYIASQGWISFGEEGNTPETLGLHFKSPQISALPVDATVPGAMVSYLQDADKLVVTYEGAGSAAKAGSNDFQVEMFFDGTIRLSYVNVDETIEGIVGLSFGGTVYEREFVESDLTNTPPLKMAF